MSREVFKADALTWLAKQPDASWGNVFTGLPDMHETHHKTIGAYAEWATRAVSAPAQDQARLRDLLQHRPPHRRHVDRQVVPAQPRGGAANVPLRWHKIVMRRRSAHDHPYVPYSHDVFLGGRTQEGHARPHPRGAVRVQERHRHQRHARGGQVHQDHSPHNVVVDPRGPRDHLVASQGWTRSGWT